jgi:uncharacterized cupredoxin-like copper-binding protein
MTTPLIRASRLRTLIVGAAMLMGCANAAPATSGPATTGPTTVVAPTAVATAAPTRAPATPTPEILAIEASFELDVAAPNGALEITMTAIPAPAYSPKELTAPAGTITLLLKNPDDRVSAQHDLKIGKVLLQTSAATPRILPGHSGVLTLEDVDAGTYVFWCSFANHYLSGMQGVLTVTL